MRTTGHDRLHSCRHFLGLHLSVLTMAILVILSVSSSSFRFPAFDIFDDDGGGQDDEDRHRQHRQM
jgi:hypothetical protein